MSTQPPLASEAGQPGEIDRATAGAPELIVTDRSGVERTIQGKDGLSIMEIIRDSGADEPFALCGGHCSCATCHVYIDAAFIDAIPQIGAEENDLLDSSDHRRETSRLSCQVVFQDAMNGIRIEIAPAD